MLGSVGGAIAGRQQPGKDGIFNLNKAENPFKTWNMVHAQLQLGSGLVWLLQRLRQVPPAQTPQLQDGADLQHGRRGDPRVLLSEPERLRRLRDKYTEGPLALRQSAEPTGDFASYDINGAQNKTFHQHIWRPRFYEAAQDSTTIARWASDFLAGKMTQVGP